MTHFSCQTCKYFGSEHPDYPGLHFCLLPQHGYRDDRMDIVPRGCCQKWEADHRRELLPGGLFGCFPCGFMEDTVNRDNTGRDVWC